MKEITGPTEAEVRASVRAWAMFSRIQPGNTKYHLSGAEDRFISSTVLAKGVRKTQSPTLYIIK